MPSVTAAVVGAAGYVGGELIRLLLGHPRVEVVAAVASRCAGRRVDGVHPNLRGWTDLVFSRGAETPAADVAFLVASPAEAAAQVPGLARRSGCLIELSSVYRLAGAAAAGPPDGTPSGPPGPLDGAGTPGWPEMYREELLTASRISVPGALVVAAVLAIRPLALAGLVKDGVAIDERIGSSVTAAGAGPDNLHAERSGSMRLLAPFVQSLEAEVSQATGLAVRMSVSEVEAVRGVQALCHLRLRRPVGDADVRRLYRECYSAESFVRVVAARHGAYRLPEPKILIGSNLCDVGFAVGTGGDAITVIGALDNLGKGSAGNAVQCLNIRMGMPEQLGLSFPGLHPI
jgi:LysW-gamma-L-alpha-aminoadipyl-6-phosphate/LysW-L-glutamyl-5-phosphate reductase